jgi:hypothetical protein
MNNWSFLMLKHSLAIYTDRNQSTLLYQSSLTTTISNTITLYNSKIDVQSSLITDIGSSLTALDSRIITFEGIRGGVYSNAIINGGMEICQRATHLVSVVNAKFTTADKFRYFATGAMVHSCITDTDVPPEDNLYRSLNIKCATIDSSLTAGDFCHIGQYIEGYNFSSFHNKTFTLSFWAKTNQAGNYSVAYRNIGATRSFVSGYTLDNETWKKIIITCLHNSTGTWDKTTGNGLEVSWTLAASSTYQTSNSQTWENGNYTALQNYNDNLCATSGKYLKITGVQLNLGSTALKYVPRSYNEELELCQRYYWVIALGAVQEKIVSIGHFLNSTTVSLHVVTPKVTMRRAASLDYRLASDFMVRYYGAATASSVCTSLSSDTGNGTSGAIDIIATTGAFTTPQGKSGYLFSIANKPLAFLAANADI